MSPKISADVLADLLTRIPAIWNEEFTEEQKEAVKDWWRGPNYAFNHDEETVQELVEWFENYSPELVPQD